MATYSIELDSTTIEKVKEATGIKDLYLHKVLLGNQDTTSTDKMAYVYIVNTKADAYDFTSFNADFLNDENEEIDGMIAVNYRSYQQYGSSMMYEIFSDNAYVVSSESSGTTYYHIHMKTGKNTSGTYTNEYTLQYGQKTSSSTETAISDTVTKLSA